jgi:hypothetical protein
MVQMITTEFIGPRIIAEMYLFNRNPYDKWGPKITLKRLSK